MFHADEVVRFAMPARIPPPLPAWQVVLSSPHRTPDVPRTLLASQLGILGVTVTL